jgi:hypothetical protein
MRSGPRVSPYSDHRWTNEGPQPDRAGAISVSGSPFRAGSLPPQINPDTDSVRLVSFRFTSTYSRIFRPRTRPLSRPLELITPNTTPNTPLHSSLTDFTGRLLRSNPPGGDVSYSSRCRRRRALLQCRRGSGFQGFISTGVPTGTSCHISSISRLVTAMQPSVQSISCWRGPSQAN